jgi:hypothetical protein
MYCLDIVWGIVSPGAAHSFRSLVVRNDVVVVGELVVTDAAPAGLLCNFSVHQSPHFRPAILVLDNLAGDEGLRLFELHVSPTWAWEVTPARNRKPICGSGTILWYEVSWHSSFESVKNGTALVGHGWWRAIPVLLQFLPEESQCRT